MYDDFLPTDHVQRNVTAHNAAKVQLRVVKVKG
jgi:hypothetical protein